MTPMAVPVKNVDPPHYHLPITSWQMLGQLQIEAGSNPDGTLKTWLMKTLDDFSLPGELVSRLLASMQEATARILGPKSIETQLEHLEIVVLISLDPASKGHTWGFFRVEKASVDLPTEGPNGHCVEYYLYLDKKAGE